MEKQQKTGGVAVKIVEDNTNDGALHFAEEGKLDSSVDPVVNMEVGSDSSDVESTFSDDADNMQCLTPPPEAGHNLQWVNIAVNNQSPYVGLPVDEPKIGGKGLEAYVLPPPAASHNLQECEVEDCKACTFQAGLFILRESYMKTN